MILREVIEGIRMGARDLAAEPKKDYTIGFEFEVALKGRHSTDGDYDDPDDIDDMYDDMYDEFSAQWFSGASTFDFEDWFNGFIRHDNGMRTVKNHLSPRYGVVKSAEKYRKYLQKQEAKRVHREIKRIGEEKIKKIKKFREIFKSEEDIEGNFDAAKQMIRFVYNDIRNYTKYETDEDWENAFQSLSDEKLIKNAKTAFDTLKYTIGEISQREVEYDFNQYDIDDEVFIYANEEKTDIVNTAEDIVDIADVIQYYDTDLEELRDITQDEWSAYESEEMSQAFIDWTNSQTRASNSSRIRYVKKLVNDLGYFKWNVVEDNTPGVDAEIVTSVMNVDQGIDAMKKVFRMIAQDEYLYTDSSTGLHVNIGSWTGSDYNKVDWLKFLIVYRAERALVEFERQVNTYATDKLPTILKDLEANSLQLFYNNIEIVNSTVLGLSPKMSAVNLSKLPTRGHIEIRAPGGTEYHLKGEVVENQVRRAIRALEIASDPDAYKTEYVKKLYTLLSKQKDKRVGISPIDQFFIKIGNVTYDKNNPIQSLSDVLTRGFDPNNADKMYNMSIHKELVNDLKKLSAEDADIMLGMLLKVFNKAGNMARSKFIRLLLKEFSIATQ